MTTSLGWKDVLRPIRDGYRHLFPSPDSGPTPEERRKRREQDKLKGFTYFDTLEQVESWTESESDILQRANTPLLVRCSVEESTRNSRAPLMLCHDYAGNYHDYEDAKSIGVEEPLYACEYLQYVDSFVYFSHKLVCVPPPTWINTLHRNGVKALGTMIFEPQTENTERLLQHTGDGAEMLFPFGKKLASISRHFGFDGWLINIEKPFPKEHWSPDVLTGFLNNLRAELGDDMELVWYDALTTSNEVYYQNGLNLANLPFAEACGKILTNYCWNARQAQGSAIVAAAQSEFGPRNVYMGIDVWAQNATWYSHPRTTYPKSNGGGTNTSIAVARSGEFGLSACAFGPAWSFEHFPGRGRELERTVWENEPLPPDLICSCGSATSRHKPEGYGLTAHAKLFPAGSDRFFYTDMSRAFGLNVPADAGKLFKGRYRSQLGTQSLLPIPTPQDDRTQQSRLSHRLKDEAGQSHLVVDCHNGVTTENPTNRYFNRWLPLYKVDMSANGSLHITIKGQRLITDEDGVPSIYLKFSGETKYSTQQGHNPQLVPFTESTPSSQNAIIFKNSSDRDARLEEIGVYLAGYSGEGVVPVMKISEISITPKEYVATLPSHAISNLRAERRGEGENGHMRLCWNIQEHVVGVAPRLEGLPYSEISGPFSYFEVMVHEVNLGRAYSTEHVLSKELLELIRGQEVEIRVTGFGFDGRQLAEGELSFHLD